MNIYFAPMEGITGYIYRNVHHKFYPGIDKYFTPFLSPGPEKGLGSKEIRDVLPENNPGICLIPQILTNRAEDFIKTAAVLSDMGYQEINLNLGCPSGTVTAKGKGAGFLAHPQELDRFLDRIFSESEPEISVKTRIGKTSPDEFGKLLDIYNRYPLKELIIHPRIQTDMYKNIPNLEVYRKAAAACKSPAVYNGDLFTVEDVRKFFANFPETETIMLGRGMIADPGLAEKIRRDVKGGRAVILQQDGGPDFCREARLDSCQEVRLDSCQGVRPYFCQEVRLDSCQDGGPYSCQEVRPDSCQEARPDEKEEMRRLKAFMEELCCGYEAAFSGDRNVLFKMKEIWCYMIRLFPDSGKLEKSIKKAQSLAEYRAAADCLFGEKAGI